MEQSKILELQPLFCTRASLLQAQEMLEQNAELDCQLRLRFADRPPTQKETERLLHNYQKYRRGTKQNAPSQFLIGAAIDEAIIIIRKLRRRDKL